jgi:hypothetical protein
MFTVPIIIIVIAIICKGVGLYYNIVKKQPAKGMIWVSSGLLLTSIGLLIALSIAM